MLRRSHKVNIRYEHSEVSHSRNLMRVHQKVISHAVVVISSLDVFMRVVVVYERQIPIRVFDDF